MDENKKHWQLYVLKLEQGKYYVGITSKTPKERFNEHKNNFMAAAWTKTYQPLSILDTKDLGFVGKEQAEAYENKVVREYIKKYGIDNARGGDLTTTEELTVRFGYVLGRLEYQGIIAVMVLFIIILALGFLYYLK